jgi:hypothetical protein
MTYRVSDGRSVEESKPLGLGGAEILFGLVWGLVIGVIYQSLNLGVGCFLVLIAADAIARYVIFKVGSKS